MVLRVNEIHKQIKFNAEWFHPLQGMYHGCLRRPTCNSVMLYTDPLAETPLN